MYDLLKTVVIMSGLGFCLTALLLILKPITAKYFPAKWQYFAWICVLALMLIPFWRLIPPERASMITDIPRRTSAPIIESGSDAAIDASPEISDSVPIKYRKIKSTSVRVVDVLGAVWAAGAAVYLAAVLISYAAYLRRNGKSSVALSCNAVFDSVCAELGIKRRIRLKMSPSIKSPLLCGVIIPVVYIPCSDISDEKLRMVFLHELTHYKRKDLAVKWIAVFANAVHWFNPLAYLLTANIGETCEVSCDMRVTKDMSDTERTLYMKTILESI